VEPRYSCGPATPGRLSRDDESQARRAWVLNLSASGVGLLLESPLEPDTQIVIHLKSVTSGTAYHLPARVVHSTSQPNGEWLIGCELAQKLTPDDLEALL
jgi:hypothetical protein